MPKQRLLRVLCHKIPSLRLAAVDCVTGTKTLLAEGADWEDEGDSDPDNEPEEEGFGSEGIYFGSQPGLKTCMYSTLCGSLKPATMDVMLRCMSAVMIPLRSCRTP
jgi:hypothetical protein